MFYLSKDRELTTDLLFKMINHFNLSVRPKLEKYKNYYDGVQAILNKKYSDDSKPCNKTVINYCKNIVDSYAGYLATPGHISYASQNDIEDIMDILRYNDYQTQDGQLVKTALTYSVAHELMYIDSEAKTRFKLIDPLTCFGVYDNSLTADLLYFVRFYKINDWDDKDNAYAVDVYTDNSVRHYSMNGFNSTPSFLSEEPHYFGQCPANILVLPDEVSIFDCILSEQDSVNELLSAEIDDYSAFCDAYLVIEDAEMEEDTVKTMKENRVLQLPQGAKAYWLTSKTAYQSAVEGGYSGTEAQFEADLSHFEQWKDDAETAASNASTSATSAAGSVTQAHQEYLDAKNQADRAQAYADFIEPHFIIQDNRLYIKDDALTEFVVADNRLYLKLTA